MSTYIKDSAQLLHNLKKIKQLPKNSWLFTADAESMYANIDTNHAREVISQWLDSLSLPKGFPLAAVKVAMELVMRKNIFVWGDCYFLWLLSTAMGTSDACMWAAIYFVVHEMGSIIQKFYGWPSPYKSVFLISNFKSFKSFVFSFMDNFRLVIC